MKYLGINLKSYVEYLYAVNYGTIVNKIKEGLNKWIYVWIGRHNIVKMPILPKLMHKFKSTPASPRKASVAAVKLILTLTKAKNTEEPEHF